MDNLSICVFGSSSDKTPSSFLKAGYELGTLLAKNKYPCVNGGGKFGVMGAVNRGIIDNNGVSIGVIHSKWVVDIDEMQDGMTKMIVVEGNNLVERKRLLFENSDAFITLPGGAGTFDELFEFICEKQLGFHNKPVVIVNIDNYYDGIIAQLNEAKRHNLLHSNVENMVYVCSNIEDALEYCQKESTNAMGFKVALKERKKKINIETLSIFNKQFTTGIISGVFLGFSVLKLISRL